jgi:predicted nucleotidyltransferase component of viral defense system
MLEKPADLALRATQDHFGFRLLEPVEKDWYVVQAMRAILAVDAAPFRLVFAGGTCLARAHRLVERMSEDVDFKIVPAADMPASKNQLRQALGRLREHIVEALNTAGFVFAEAPRSRDANQYTVLHLCTDSGAGQGGPLRQTIQVELSFAEMRQPTLRLPVASFVSEAYKHRPELELVECVSVTETAAEKAVSLTRRTAMEIAGVSRATDPTLVRHIYDLHMIRDQVDPGAVATLMRAVAQQDAAEFGHQHPSYSADIPGETRKALAHLQIDPEVRARYERFVAAMVYGQAASFDEAIKTVAELAETAWP